MKERDKAFRNPIIFLVEAELTKLIKELKK